MLKILSPSYVSSEKSEPVHFRYICRVLKTNIFYLSRILTKRLRSILSIHFQIEIIMAENTRDRWSHNPVIRTEHTTRNLTELKRNEMKLGANYYKSIFSLEYHLIKSSILVRTSCDDTCGTIKEPKICRTWLKYSKATWRSSPSSAHQHDPERSYTERTGRNSGRTTFSSSVRLDEIQWLVITFHDANSAVAKVAGRKYCGCLRQRPKAL
jgi:hypothetical protein